MPAKAEECLWSAPLRLRSQESLRSSHRSKMISPWGDDADELEEPDQVKKESVKACAEAYRRQNPQAYPVGTPKDLLLQVLYILQG
ncbi:uncharacterized [Tachysurus ichikawai]